MKAYILVGAPGSGKSTWSKNFVQKNPDVIRLCPDEFRAKIGISESDQSVSFQAFCATYGAMEDALRNGKDVMIDATNMYRKTRKKFLDIAHKWNVNIEDNVKTIAVVFEATRETCIERNAKRGKEGGRIVPEEVVDTMLSKYQRPDELEFDEVMFISKL